MKNFKAWSVLITFVTGFVVCFIFLKVSKNIQFGQVNLPYHEKKMLGNGQGITAEQLKAARNMHDFISSRVERARRVRDRYWKRDFLSVESYLLSVEKNRRDLVAFYRVPKECLSGISPNVEKELIRSTLKNVRLYRMKINVCEGNVPELYAILGIPSGGTNQKFPVIIAIHGTAGSPERLFGIDNVDDYHHKFALKLLESGFAVFAPGIVTRLLPDKFGNYNRERNEIDNRATMVGYRLLGLEIGQIISAVDYIVERKDFKPESLGIYGVSLGGFLSFSLAAIEKRIKVAVVSQYFESLERKFTAMDYETAYWKYENADYMFFDSLLLYFSNLDIASLIVPRKLMIEVGSKDPRSGDSISIFPDIEKLYSRLGQDAGSAAIAVEDGGHEVFMKDTLKFLKKWLK